MLDFAPLQITDREQMQPYLQRDGAIMSDRCFSSLYIWGEHYGIKQCIRDNTLFVQAHIQEDICTYYMPLGADLARAMALLEQDAAERGLPYEVMLITAAAKEEIEALFPGKYEFEEQRAEYDYIYHAEELISLQGKKLRNKRNHVNRFLTENNGRWEYSEVDPVADYDEIMAFLQEWCMRREGEIGEDYCYEYSAIRRALTNYEQLNMQGGIIRINGKVVAFTLATPQNEQVMDILIEKADADIEGAYQIINNMFASKNCVGYRYINREEDMGIEGLRKAKLSYHPCFLTEKYRAVPKK